MSSKGNRAVIYARYSTDMQNPMSVRDQIDRCRRLAADKGWQIVDEFHDDGQRATSMNRTAYNQMFDELGSNKFDILLVESWDRLVRDLEDGARLYKHADYHSVMIYRADQGQVGLLDATFSSLMSSLFLDGLADKTRRGLSGKIGEGQSAGGLSYGYKVPTDAKGLRIKGTLEINCISSDFI